MSRLTGLCGGVNQTELSVYWTSGVTHLAHVDEVSWVWDTCKSARTGRMQRALLNGMNTMKGING